MYRKEKFLAVCIDGVIIIDFSICDVLFSYISRVDPRGIVISFINLFVVSIFEIILIKYSCDDNK